MWDKIRHIVQYAGLFVVSACLFNGITYHPLAAVDDGGIDVSRSASPFFQPSVSTKEPDSAAKAGVLKNYGKLPLSFEVNNGQVDEKVKFLSRGNGYALYLTSGEVVLNLQRASAKDNERNALRENPQTEEPHRIENEVIRLTNIGSNRDPEIIGLEELPGKSNYFIGKDPEKWHTDVSNYAKVKIKEVYPGIDLVYYGNQHQLEYDWIVAPGFDPNSIRFAVESKNDLKVDMKGNLILDSKGELRLNKPLIYQEREGVRTEIAGTYLVLNNHEVGIQVDAYDTALPLVIDPILRYSTYLGGYDEDTGYAIAIDTSDRACIAGSTSSANFPTMNPLEESDGFFDVFVTKLNAAGDGLVYSTYLGGSDSDYGRGIAVDSGGNVYVTGYSFSDDFPTANPFQASNAGSGDSFVAKLNAAGNALVYSTYFGGSADDYALGIAVNSDGNAFITGQTDSTNLPTANPFQANNGGDIDAFVTKLNAAGDGLIYSTYLGGSEGEAGLGITTDVVGDAYVVGITQSVNFPRTTSFQTINGGGTDGFVTKLNASGDALVYSTYLGGSGSDFLRAIAVDSSGNAYVTGDTNSANFPMENPFQASYAGIYDGFVTKLNTAGDALVYSTFLGGSGDEYGMGIAVDSAGNAYVVGATGSTNFPTINPFQMMNGGGLDGFVTKLNTAGNGLVYSTFLGSAGDEYMRGIAIDSSGNAYVTGDTDSTDFPVANPLQASNGGGWDAFVIKIGGASYIYFPEIAVGGGWSTTFALCNSGSATATGNLILNDQQGNPLTVSGSEFGVDSSFSISIPPGGTLFLTVDSVNPTDPSKHGWAKVEFYEGTLSGVTTYQFHSGGDVTALAGVLPSQPMQFATVPVDDIISQDRITAYAIANPGSNDLIVKLCTVDAEGNVVDDTVTVELSPGEQTAKYFFQDLGFSEFEGTVVLKTQSGGVFIAVGLIQNQTLFTVVPVVPGKAPNIPD